MLSIQAEQFLNIENQMEIDYINDLLSFFKSEVPRFYQVINNERSINIIRLTILSAKKFGSISDRSLMQYIILTQFAGQELFENNEVQFFLGLPGYSFDYKLAWLFDRVIKNLNNLEA